MKKYLQIQLTTALLLFAGLSFAQDPHFSQFYATPLQVNPAMTGVFDGKLRICNTYRTQWSGLGKGYNTIHLSGDVPVGKTLMSHNNFFGLGFMLYQDKAGDAALTHTNIEASLAYITALDDVGDHFLSIGFQGGLIESSFDLSKSTWDSQWNGDKYDPSLPNLEPFQLQKFAKLDMSAGFLYYYVPDGLNTVCIGGSLSHIGSPNLSFFNTGDAPLRKKITLTGSGDISLDLNHTAWFDPRIMVIMQGEQKEITVGGYVKNKVQFKSHYTNYRKDAYFYLGGFYRLNDAAIFSARFEYNSVGLGLSYDFNTSYLSTLAGSANAFEVTFSYVMFVKRGERMKNYNKMPSFM